MGVYGTYDDDDHSAQGWAIKFDETAFDEIMFATMRLEHWAIITSVSFYSEMNREGGRMNMDYISSSLHSARDTNFGGGWVNANHPVTNPHEPWISVDTHSNPSTGRKIMVYGESKETWNSGNGWTSGSENDYQWPVAPMGGNVFIR